MKSELRHPLVQIREELALDRRAFALMCDVSYQAVYLVETGYSGSVPAGVLDVLEELGYDAGEVLAAHVSYREKVGQGLRLEVLERLQVGT